MGGFTDSMPPRRKRKRQFCSSKRYKRQRAARRTQDRTRQTLPPSVHAETSQLIMDGTKNQSPVRSPSPPFPFGDPSIKSPVPGFTPEELVPTKEPRSQTVYRFVEGNTTVLNVLPPSQSVVNHRQWFPCATCLTILCWRT